MQCDLNHFHGTGHIINDASLKQLPNQKCRACFHLRIDEILTTRSGAKIPKTNVLKVLAWNALAEHASTHGKAGAHVCVHARVSVVQRKGRNGETNSTFELHLTKKLTTVEEWIESLPSPPKSFVSSLAPIGSNEPPLTPKYPRYL